MDLKGCLMSRKFSLRQAQGRASRLGNRATSLFLYSIKRKIFIVLSCQFINVWTSKVRDRLGIWLLITRVWVSNLGIVEVFCGLRNL